MLAVIPRHSIVALALAAHRMSFTSMVLRASAAIRVRQRDWFDSVGLQGQLYYACNARRHAHNLGELALVVSLSLRSNSQCGTVNARHRRSDRQRSQSCTVHVFKAS